MTPSLIVRYIADPEKDQARIRVWPVSVGTVMNRFAFGPSDCVWIVPTPNPWTGETVHDWREFVAINDSTHGA